MPYPFLSGETYQETKNDFSAGVYFEVNELLLCFMIFCRLYFLVRCILAASEYTDPRAQRVCHIYGCDANYKFALRALMQNDSWKVLLLSLLISLLSLSYQMRLFERHVTHEFEHLFTSVWNILITMTTVGYGDFYPKTHLGRTIGIITAFWGVFIVSLFVVSLTNILTLDAPERKAYMLLQRLENKDLLKIEAANMVAAKFRLKKLKEEKDTPSQKKVNMAKRLFKLHKNEFNKINRQIMNIGDADADMENLKNSMESLTDDVAVMRMSQFFFWKEAMKKKAKAKATEKGRRV